MMSFAVMTNTAAAARLRGSGLLGDRSNVDVREFLDRQSAKLFDRLSVCLASGDCSQHDRDAHSDTPKRISIDTTFGCAKKVFPAHRVYTAIPLAPAFSSFFVIVLLGPCATRVLPKAVNGENANKFLP